MAGAGLPLDRVRKGEMIVSDTSWRPVRRFGARIRLLPGSSASLEDADRVRLYHGRASGEQQAVESVEQHLEFHGRPEGRNHDGDTARCFGDGGEVFLPCDMEIMGIQHAPAGRDPDDRLVS